jgi:hypothetical protein
LIQSLIDNSIFKAPTTESFMNNLGDMASGKFLSRGFAEGGDIRGFAAGGETMAEQLARIRPEIEATLKNQGWTKEAIDRYVSAYKPEMGRGFTNQFPATTAQPPSFEDMLNLQRQKAAQTGVGIKPFTAEPEAPHPFQQAAEERAARLREELQLAPHREAAEARAAKLRAIQEQAAGAQRTLPAPGPTSTSSLESVLGKNANVQDFINSLKSKQLSTTGAPTSAMPEGAENLPAVRTGTGLPAETNYGRGATVDAPYFVHPNATPNADAAAKSAWESANILDRANSKWDRGQSPEAKAWLAAQQQANAPVEGKPPVPYDPMSPGATTLEEVAAKAKQGLGSLGEAAKVVGRPIAKVAGALSPIGDLIMANKFTGGSNALLAQALSGQTPSGAMQGDIPEVAKDLMTAPSVPDWAKNIGSAINSKVPSVPQTDISQFGVDTKSAIPQQPTIGDFSGSVPETKGPTANDKGVITNPHSANKHENTTANIAAINRAHGQDQPQPTTPVDRAVTQAAALAQTDQAVSKSSDTGMGQGSILDSLYSKLKDSDVDYSDLAKRISQNEYDLARERKDGTTNAILGGIGAALTQAGTYQGVGDRVFKPGLGAIAGAGIMGGLKMSAASDEAISKKSQDNMTAMIALKKLKRESMNDVLDALSAQKQVDAITRGQDITAGTHAATNKNAVAKLAIESRMADIAELSANADMLYKQAQAKKLDIEGIVDQKDKMLLEALNKQLGDQVTLLNGAAKDLNLTPEQRQGYQARLDSTQSQLNDLYAKYQSFAPKVAPSGADYSDPSYKVKSVVNK